jgi:hydroxyacylglutathione hydrolase
MHLEPIPAFEDNYIWAVHDGRSALFVDPGEAAPILSWLEQQSIRPVAILVTHHHGDHCGGLPELLARYDIPVYGPAHETIRGVNQPLSEGMACRIPELELSFRILDIPGHTPGHIAYLGHGWLFCGDTIFSCGCGKVFGSTVEHLYASLTRLASLPKETLVCCAHEYTLDNIRFALTIDPANPALLAWREQAEQLRRQGRPTLPVTLGDELARNPFLRSSQADIQTQLIGITGLADLSDPGRAFAVLRREKDRFG